MERRFCVIGKKEMKNNMELGVFMVNNESR